jgi:hypothetical protein
MTAGVDGQKTRNPFGVIDVPNPNGSDIDEFAARPSFHEAACALMASRAAAHEGDVGRSIEGVVASFWDTSSRIVERHSGCHGERRGPSGEIPAGFVE